MTLRSRTGVASVLALALALTLGPAAPSRGAGDVALETPRSLPVEEALARTLASPRYRFCFDPKYPLLSDEVRWCDHLPRSPDSRATRCPSFAAACRAGATADLVHGPKPVKIELPNFGGLGRLVFLTLAIAGAGLLVFLVVRHGMRLPAARRSRREDTPVANGSAPAAEASRDEIVERDVERLLARARGAAAAGDFIAAISDLHAALLRRLEGDGHVRIHPSATNGDYVIQLRGRAPTLAGPVGDVVRDVETAEFGGTLADGGMYRALLGRITPLLLRSGGAATTLLLALLLALSPSCQPPIRADWPASPSGAAAVAEFLTAAGLEARARLLPLKDLGKDNGKDTQGKAAQIVLLPDAETSDADWIALRDWLGDPERTLILATGPRPLPSWLTDIELVPTGAADVLHATPALKDLGRRPVPQGYVPGGAWVRTGVLANDALMVRGKRAYAAEAPVDAGRVIVLADGRLFTNAALVVGDNAALLAALLRSGGGPVEFVGEDTGVVAPTPLASVARGRLAPFLAQLGACLILFLLAQGRAFGRLVDPDVTHRRAFGEHVRALGTQYARARAAAHVLGSYATWAVDRLRERIRLSGDRGIGDLSSVVAARTGRPLGDVARVLFAARRDGDGSGDPVDEDRSRGAAGQHLAMMRELRQLLIETSGVARGQTGTHHQQKGRPRI